MARGKRDRRETIRSMAVAPDLFDAAAWQQPDVDRDDETGGDAETASQPSPETS